MWTSDNPSAALLLRNTCLLGDAVDVLLRDGRIAEIGPAGSVVSEGGGEVLDAECGLLSRPFADPHIHLDAALLGARTPNVSGTLQEGIKNWGRARETLTADDVGARATQTIRWCVAQGTTRIRTHADTASKVGVETLLALREEVAHLCDLQVVAFPQDGVFTGPGREEGLRWAAAAGVDAVGAIPHHESNREDGDRSVRLALDLAEQHGCQVDLHCDESDDPASRHLETLCRQVLKRGFEPPVIAGHCTAMHSYPDDYAAKVIDLVVESGVQVVANPLDNVVLQGRHDGYPRRRGITRVPELLAAGARVGCGHDSIQDPWYPLGRGCLLEAASMLVHVAQMTRPEEIGAVFDLLAGANHFAFGGVAEIAVGTPADLQVHAVPDKEAAIRLARPPRWVIRGGAVLAETKPAESTVSVSTVSVSTVSVGSGSGSGSGSSSGSSSGSGAGSGSGAANSISCGFQSSTAPPEAPAFFLFSQEKPSPPRAKTPPLPVKVSPIRWLETAASLLFQTFNISSSFPAPMALM